MNCYMNDEDHIVCDTNLVLKNCLDILATYQKKISDQENLDIIKKSLFPNLPSITHEELLIIQRSISLDKAITFDGLCHDLFKLDKSEMLLDSWNSDTLSISNKFYECRLVALNKKFPNIPSKEQFRPIVIISPLVKFLELRFIPKLKNYITNEMEKY